MRYKNLLALLAISLIVTMLFCQIARVNATPSYLTAITNAASRLLALQSNAPFVPPYASPPANSPDYGWDWNVTGLSAHTNSRSATNLYGVTALGLFEVSNKIGLKYLVSAAHAATFMAYGNSADGDFWNGMPPDYYYYWGYAADYEFLVRFGSNFPAFGAYALSAWNWMVANVSYYNDGSQAQTWAHFYDVYNEPGYAAWSTGFLGVDALLMGDTPWAQSMADVIHANIPALMMEGQGANNCNDLGMGEALLFFATSPYASATYAADITALATHLLADQNAGTGAWQQNGTDSTQTTAYAVMGLYAAGYYTAAQAGANWLVSNQLGNGGWLESTADPTEYSETDSEAVQAINLFVHFISVTSSPGTGSGLVKVDGTDYGTPHRFTWQTGDTHTIAAQSPVSGGVDTQYTFASWNDSGAQSHTYTVPPQDATVTADYTTQFYLTVNNGGHGTTSGAGWCNLGATAPFSISPTTVTAGTTQYVFTGWSSSDSGGYTGSASSSSVTMNNPITETANWKEQFWVSFTQSGLDSSATGTVVTINGMPETFANLPIAGWFDSGTTYSYSSQISSTAPGERFMQTNVSGPSSPITTAGTVTGNYKTQYYLTVSSYSELVPAPTPTTGWFDAGSQVTLTAPQTGHDPNGTLYAFQGIWTVNGVDKRGNTVQITMTSSPTVAIAWYTDPPPFGDVNDDGRVDLADLVLVARHYGTVLEDPGYSTLYDLNGDGRIDLLDLAAVARAIQP